ncbi:hypothetical protein FSS13T_15730 [Flavobacterium saliperosum S13]|uniref:Bacteriophage abortive infection AbiH n=2 Tax=Flavobacterium saliperosum TaxID=329186 RepID=A0A1G4VGN3_9FLAO|nr:AbiH family protein [Flavobacterium saliperosum]ESU25621.1 hypothetical protein FSS13T_15730 [Flavobacterium saliperosum S13]SCX06502.1 Bacteriophage abortive infection AbiH [Flavobacterium saliperosum]
MVAIRVKLKPTTIKINKIFLIGNGFDLALGLKTKYSDFLLWLIKKYIIDAIESNVSIAPFDKYKGRYIEFLGEYEGKNVKGFSTNSLFDVLLSTRFYYDKDQLNKIDKVSDLFEYISSKEIEINTKNAPFLFAKILHSSSNNLWVDIEGVYFEILKEIIKTYKNNLKKDSLDLIDNINQEFSLIIDYLKKYLSEIDTAIIKNDAKVYFTQFQSDLEKNDFSFLHNQDDDVSIGNSYFLNFNYTDSLSNLLGHFKNSAYIQNHIHGNFKDTKNSIIFGFGDEMDDVYKEIEELNDNRFFEHIKSFQYFKTPNYRELLSFLNSGDYQVCIYGHSCGLSDRIMLNEIFEHENCKSIKIYYYNDDDFTRKTMEISRHFNSNQLMRKKIVNKNNDCLIPQVKK